MRIIPLANVLSLMSLVFIASCGGGGGSDSSSSTTPTIPTNAAPTVAAANADQTGQVGVAFTYDATQAGGTFTDADGDTLTYMTDFNPGPNGLSATNGVISGTPTTIGTTTVTITASDGNGGSVSDTFNIVISVDQDAVQAKFGGQIDLENLENYANPTIPDYITDFNDGGNPVTDAGATLGRILFYDVALSIDDTIACASCHVQENAFSDLGVVSTGVEGGQTGRHSMRLVNTQYADETRFFWDERADSHEDQESQPLADHNEHGFSGVGGRPDLNDLIAKIEGLDYYQELFNFVYGDATVTEVRLQESLAQFTKSIHSFDSKYDTGRAQVNNNNADFPNFTVDENVGKMLFMEGRGDGGAGCAGCHQPPEFDIRQGSDNNGVVGVANDPTSFDFTNTRSPTLRDMIAADGTTVHGPFMHDGSLATLRAVIDHYNDIQAPTSEPERTQFFDTIDNRLLQGGNTQFLNLSDTEKDQIEIFLRTLTGVNMYTDEKWSNPF